MISADLPYRAVDAKAVEAAASAAMAAFSAAADDRHRLYCADFDHYCDFELLADRLHGHASWVIEGAKHPAPVEVIKDLQSLQSPLRLDWKLRLKHYPQLETYRAKLDELREQLLTCFAAP